MRAQIVELTECHIKTQLCSAQADHNKWTVNIEGNVCMNWKEII